MVFGPPCRSGDFESSSLWPFDTPTNRMAAFQHFNNISHFPELVKSLPPPHSPMVLSGIQEPYAVRLNLFCLIDHIFPKLPHFFLVQSAASWKLQIDHIFCLSYKLAFTRI